MGRGYGQRKRERVDRLKERAEWLKQRIESRAAAGYDAQRDKQERSALLWVLEEVELLSTVANTIECDIPDDERVAIIRTLMRSRIKPTQAELDRHPALKKQGLTARSLA